jgi:GNAT superfamily N-acetyltransferase
MSKSIAKVRAPKGFTFRVSKMNERYTKVTLRLTLTNREIGHVSLIKVREGYYETHSDLSSEYHGKGLGALLYARAIQHGLEKGWRVQSSGSSSSEAQRVWRGKSIRKYFSIKLKKGDDPYYDKWYAYAK